MSMTRTLTAMTREKEKIVIFQLNKTQKHNKSNVWMHIGSHMGNCFMLIVDLFVL